MTDKEVDAYRKKALDYLLIQLQGHDRARKDHAAELILQHCYASPFAQLGDKPDES